MTQFQSPTGVSGHLAAPIVRAARTRFHQFQSPTGVSGHLAKEQQKIGVLQRSSVSIPNGRLRPFSRLRPGPRKYDAAKLRFNPQRASQAI